MKHQTMKRVEKASSACCCAINMKYLIYKKSRRAVGRHIWFILSVIAITALSSCQKDEFESNRDTVTSFATIHAEKGKPYSLIPDNHSATMYITKTSIPENELIHQRHVIATYTLLKDVTPKNLMDHSFWNVRLDQIMDVTCKPPVLKSQIEDADNLGTGVLNIRYFQFTGQYFNLEYEHAGGNHDINLWFDDTGHPASNTWIISLCINSPATEPKIKGYVSFDISNLYRETRESLYLLNPDARDPFKLILRYYESADRQKELHYEIRYYEYGFVFIPED